MDDDVERRFQENDNLGDCSSFWYRATRLFFDGVGPVGKTTMLTAGPSLNDQSLVLGLLTHTKNRRLIYWPALAKGGKMVEDGGETMADFDHITLEFPSERTHLTYYDERGVKQHLSREGRTYPIGNSPLSAWFQILVKIEVLRNQDMEIQRLVQATPEHKSRMVEWLNQFCGSISGAPIIVPLECESQDYIHYAVHLDPKHLPTEQLPPIGQLLDNAGLSKYVTGWETGKDYKVAVSPVNVEGVPLRLVAACPPGTLRPSVACLLARRRRKAHV